MIYLHKTLPLLISPMILIIALMVFGVIKHRQSFMVVAVFTLYLCSMPVVSGYLLRQIEFDAVRLEPKDVPTADAIVVLSGMLTWVPGKNGVIQEWADPDRFWGGIELMQANKAPTLIFTGGKLPWESGSANEGNYLKKYARLLNIPEQNVIVTEDVQNTEQEAAAVGNLLNVGTAPQKTIILVTSAFHMPRALALFERQGFKVFAYPVDFKVSESALTLMSFIPNPGALGQTDLAIRELAGSIFYKIKSILIKKPVAP
jgi:uncharacterized SAM-binding protein YcdF (DUF218 family)